MAMLARTARLDSSWRGALEDLCIGTFGWSESDSPVFFSHRKDPEEPERKTALPDDAERQAASNLLGGSAMKEPPRGGPRPLSAEVAHSNWRGPLDVGHG
jgi:hypothetical protein